MSDSRIRVLSVDDHPLMRDGIAAVINNQPDMTLVAHARSASEALHRFVEHRPDVTLMDLLLPDGDGVEAAAAIRREAPDARILMLTTFEGDAEARRALDVGVSGYALKTLRPKELAEAIRRVNAGRKYVASAVADHLVQHMGDELLTLREHGVLQYVASGTRNREIGAHLGISEETVKSHVKHIMEKLGARDRTQAVTIAIRRGVLQL